MTFNTISANDFSFYDALNAVVQNEPADWVDPDTVGCTHRSGSARASRSHRTPASRPP
jgi:hypothetical protein